ncbi:PadR family transcriptional regulator [Leekyejoonella antrihumi]|uniref:PadR family transcriptional regulator n=1 Tax=Leekyejoonella antrihumi TaxID=1660198 RepID=A0A563E0I1_9MICO|nr:PadR family transcriptional regulator [Leekyejoonella antrihumi]TWP36050.1 PadR family transcriptional regulator [Leekyejoonella antrihumi]
MEAGQLLTHLRRGTLEFCVLAALHGGERYAGDLIAELGADGVLVTSEGTVYPLLARLRRDGMVESTWRESASGPPRRYYRRTRRGDAAVRHFTDQWGIFRDAVDRVLTEEQ